MIGPRRALPALLLSAGCADWPRADHLPSPGPLVVSGDEPAPAVAWGTLDVAGLPQPPGASIGALDVGVGVQLEGVLDGLGWNDAAAPQVIVGEVCESQGARTPDLPGDYLGDVRVFDLTVSGGALLCATLEVDTPDVGLDLLLWRLDACGVPEALVTGDDGAPLGLFGRDPVASWAAAVERGDRFAVLVAGYAPNALDVAVPFRLSLAIPDRSPFCPAPPWSGP